MPSLTNGMEYAMDKLSRILDASLTDPSTSPDKPGSTHITIHGDVVINNAPPQPALRPPDGRGWRSETFDPDDIE